MKKRWIFLIIGLVLIIVGLIIAYFIIKPNEIILAGEMKIPVDFGSRGKQEIGLYPAKVKIEKLWSKYKLKYTITNYGSETVDLLVYNKVPNKMEEGYEQYKTGEEIYLEIPEKYLTIEGGDKCETEIIVGCPDREAFENNIELWIGFKSLREGYNLELNSRVLLEG